MNMIMTNFLHWIFGTKNKSGLTIPEIQRMKKMHPKEKKKFLREREKKGKWKRLN